MRSARPLGASALALIAGIWVLGRATPSAVQLPRDQVKSGRTFRSQIELVMIPATVTDSSGRLVADLTREAFEIFEDGAKQPITYFSTERVPVSLGLVVDVSDSMFGRRMQEARTALGRFLGELLKPEDETALVLFNHRPDYIGTWTLDRQALRERIDAVKPFGGTAIYDALAEALPLFEQRAHPRAAIVLVSDGADTASDRNVMAVRRLLQRTDVFVYAIAIDEAHVPINTRVNPYALRELTDPTGGYTELVTDAAELAPATARIADELNAQYMLGYSPTHNADAEYHSIRVKTLRADLRVRARRGYIATPPDRTRR
jgi:Ca-activated chloride channel family protein